MRLLKSTALMFSMFTRIPMPKTEWDEENMRYIFCAFPLAGVIIGLLTWGWTMLCGVLDIETLLFAAGVTITPVAVTGGIHLDGFCDTMDALASNAPAEKKRVILKDPHTGAFAVIAVCVYMLLFFGFCTELTPGTGDILMLGLIHCISRILTGLSVIFFPSASSDGLFQCFKEASVKKLTAIVLITLLAICSAGILAAGRIAGIGMVAAALLCYLYVYRMSKRQFGGMSGDIAGYLLQITELLMLMTWVLIRKAIL